MAVEIYQFDDNQRLAESLAECVASGLEGALNLRDVATLAVSGGSTPKPLFEALSRCDIDWGRVRITQVDERWVPEDHPDSNAQLIRGYLLQNRASAAEFVSMRVAGDDVFAAESEAQQRLADFREAIDVAILGMGEDGHTASFFPGAEQLEAALDADSPALCLGLRPPAAPHDRMTLSLSAILRTRQLYLHVTGETKLAVLERALAGDDVFELPIRAVFNREESPLEVFYAPAS
jgi:6-phosphogluconolactonase